MMADKFQGAAATTIGSKCHSEYSELYPNPSEIGDRKDFPRASVEPKRVIEDVMQDKLDFGPIKPRVLAYAPKYRDFDRDDSGNPVFHSLRGPEKLAARAQFVRERFIAIAETEILREQLNECFLRERVNAKEHCKPLVKAYAELISRPYWDMLKVCLDEFSGVLIYLHV